MSECEVCGREQTPFDYGASPIMCWGSTITCYRLGYDRLRASLTTAENEKAKLEREIQFVTAEHDKAWVLLGKENDKARAFKDENTRQAAEVERLKRIYDQLQNLVTKREAERDIALAANTSLVQWRDAVTVAVQKALGSISAAEGHFQESLTRKLVVARRHVSDGLDDLRDAQARLREAIRVTGTTSDNPSIRKPEDAASAAPEAPDSSALEKALGALREAEAAIEEQRIAWVNAGEPTWAVCASICKERVRAALSGGAHVDGPKALHTAPPREE